MASLSAQEADLSGRERRLAERLAQQEGIEGALERVAAELEGEKARVAEARAAVERERCVLGLRNGLVGWFCGVWGR